jgi:hypothetical protein
MPGLGFSGPNLATVAYAEVNGVAGASTLCNSGVTTTRTGLGTYVVILPTNLAQTQGRDLIFVQSLGANATPPPVFQVDDTQDATKTITAWDFATAATKIDASFAILVLRTTVTPPSGAPA